MADRLPIVRAWLRDTPAAWAGWPTYVGVTAAQRDDAQARLVRHGCPCAGIAFPHLLALIAELREEHRDVYRAQTLRALDSERED